ncbi:ABC transporter substrate-binding protein [Rhodoligotrophos defluvii]|uniref:ABC transporter substrate-binding protein n=1 Tax=Rhodoligotrophos defluvii TaxID=2561934 RepID=UPI0010C97C44|nr:ABC transporter substrate-binding protein [Rhodoligotrophos defluvii]
MRIRVGVFAAVFMLLASLPGFGQPAELVIGTEGAYPPFNFIDESGKLKGFDVDIAQALCEKMQVKCRIVAQDWEGLIPALLSKKIDAIVASMSITEERKKVVAFTDKYYHAPARFVALTTSDITDISPKGLAGKVLGAQSSTIHANYLEKNYKDSTIRLYGSHDTALLDLVAGRVDAVFVQSIAVYNWLNSPEGKCCKFVGEPLSDPAHFGLGAGIAVRKEDEALRQKLNEALDEILADGTYQKINAKYFPFSIY